MRAHALMKTRIVGNLPYYVTTPIITKLIESKARFGIVKDGEGGRR